VKVKRRGTARNTLRSVLGYQTAPYHGFRFLMEFEDVSMIGAENCNNTTNGKVGYPVVADPDGAEVNQVYVD
jgi:hypothetical protein